MLGRSWRSATWVAIASAALMTSSCTSTTPKLHDKFDNFAYPYPGQTGTVAISATSNGKVLGPVKGPSITTTCQSEGVNWNAWVGGS